MSAAISVGRRVIWRGRVYVIHGVDPMSVTPQHVHMRDCRTGDLIRVRRVDLLARERARR